MRGLALILSAWLGSTALAQREGARGGQGATTAPPATATSKPTTRDQRLAALEEQAAALAAEIKALRADLKKAAEPRKENEFRVFAMQHAKAGEIGRLLNELFGAASPRNNPFNDNRYTSADGPRVVVDERTNSLIVYGTKDRMEAVQALLQHLDVAAEKKK